MSETEKKDVVALPVDKVKYEMMEKFLAKYAELEVYLRDMGLPFDATFDQAVINFKQGMMWIKECIYLHTPKEEPKNVQ